MANEIDIDIGSFQLDSTTGIALSSINYAIQKSVQEFEIPKGDWSVVPIAKRRAMTIRIAGAVIGSDYDALRTAMENLRNALESTAEQQFKIDDDYFLKVQYRSFSHEVVTLRTFARFSVEFIASYPFWQSVSITTADPAWTTGVGFTVNNPGTAPCRVRVRVIPSGGAVADDILVENQTTGESFQYAGSVANGQTLAVDNRVYQDELQVLNNSVDAIEDFSGDFITLNPGNNTIVFTCAQSACDIQFDYRKTMR